MYLPQVEVKYPPPPIRGGYAFGEGGFAFWVGRFKLSDLIHTLGGFLGILFIKQ